MGAHHDKRFDLRRRNYGARAEGIINDVLVALDLLFPDRALEQKEHLSITSELLLGSEPSITVTVRPSSRIPRRKLQITTYWIDRMLVASMLEHGLITKERLVLKTVGVPTADATVKLDELLALHDAMHVGHTLHLRQGIYRHFKGDDRLYSMLGVSADTEDGTMRVFYQPLHGKHYGKLCNRTLAMFTQVIARDGYVGPRWRLVHAQKVDILTRHGEL